MNSFFERCVEMLKNLEKIIAPTLIILIFTVALSCNLKNRRAEKTILVYVGNEKDSEQLIQKEVSLISNLAKEKEITMQVTTSPSQFNQDTLERYSGVLFLNVDGSSLTRQEEIAFERYIQAGGGFLGINSAPDITNRYLWPWYKELNGAFVNGQLGEKIVEAFDFDNNGLSFSKDLQEPWKEKERLNSFSDFSEGLKNILTNKGDKSGIVWFHEFDGGRSFFIGVGNTIESLDNKQFSDILAGGLDYMIGKNKELNYNLANSIERPDDNRFEKKFLAGGFDEPTELTVLPNLDILVVERKGAIKYYNAQNHTIREVANIPVYHHALKPDHIGNVEMGLLGIQKDPHYDDNHWIYIYYSPVDTSVDRLSRFKFENGVFDLNSEQEILDVKTDREICCHTGGSIGFGSNDDLYLTTGDNTTPFNEGPNPVTRKPQKYNTNGYAPLDDRPGYYNHDDRRSAGNTNDLRGKVLRIHVNEDGTYSIPDGNLFPVGTEKTRPEIYAMGGRNVYRISIDQHKGYVYWGEVGPDARADSLETRGPRGYDEINQAKEAGFFGWPFLIGDNIPYVAYNYATGVSGKPFDAKGPVNDSKNNTGQEQLPPAQPAFIWYPYDRSDIFPMLGTGGRTAMAGPVYYVDDYPKKTRYPDYFDKKFFIYDFMRNWIKLVTLNDNGDLESIEPFMDGTKFNAMIDMEAGPDGRIYIVEYGTGKWFGKNDNSGLYVLDYNSGNRPPIAELMIDKTSGAVPLTIKFSADKTIDPDKDKLTYKWNFGEGNTISTEGSSVSHTYSKAGEYAASVTVEDGNGGVSKSSEIMLYAGNSRPQIDIQITRGNKSFYLPHSAIGYKVDIKDKEDKTIDTKNAIVQVQYMEDENQINMIRKNPEVLNSRLVGRGIMESLDCQACHKVDESSIGPSFKQVSERYKDNRSAHDMLVQKIINGGSGNWGETAMSAHPELKPEDAGTIVNWILSLERDEVTKSFPLQGSFDPSALFSLNNKGVIVISANYTDKGASGVRALTGSRNLILDNPMISSVAAVGSETVSEVNGRGQYFKMVNGSGWIHFKGLDLDQVNQLGLGYTLIDKDNNDWQVEVRLDSPDGRIIGDGHIGRNQKMRTPSSTVINLKDKVTGVNDLYIVLKEVDGADGRIGISNLVL